jgi:predicted XRE-type DNA-binding protein
MADAASPRLAEGQPGHPAGRDRLRADPAVRVNSAEGAARKELWLQLVEARQAAGLTQAQLAERLGVTQSQVARMEKRGYDAYTLKSLRRYVQALGPDFSLEVTVRRLPRRP